MSGVKEIFEEYFPYFDKDAQFTLAGDMKDWSWFKIYVFPKKRLIWKRNLRYGMIFCQNMKAVIMKNYLFVWRIFCCMTEPLALFQERKNKF